MRVGINGFGRIGRYLTRLIIENPAFELVVINDLTDVNTAAHLLKYDSVHGRFPKKIDCQSDGLRIDDEYIEFTSIERLEDLNWKKYDVDIVIEATGRFKTKDLLCKHLIAGANKVLLSAPSIENNIPNIVYGVNSELIGDEVLVSNASCTTNSAAPMIQVMKGLTSIKSAFITTVHSYTSDQRLHDAAHYDLRRARAAGESIIPTTTGAAKALVRIFPELDGNMGGCGVRVPVPNGSMTDMTFVVDNPPSVTEINAAMKKASQGALKGVLEYTEDALVSKDIIGQPCSCLFDSQLTSVVGNMVKIVGWYDNESGYTNRLIDVLDEMGKTIV